MNKQTYKCTTTTSVPQKSGTEVFFSAMHARPWVHVLVLSFVTTACTLWSALTNHPEPTIFTFCRTQGLAYSISGIREAIKVLTCRGRVPPLPLGGFPDPTGRSALPCTAQLVLKPKAFVLHYLRPRWKTRSTWFHVPSREKGSSAAGYVLQALPAL